MPPDLVTCETLAAIVIHVRRVGDKAVDFGGHVDPKPVSLCGRPVNWDTHVPVAAATCRRCMALMEEDSSAS